MPVWCTTSSGNVKVKVEVDLLSLSAISLTHIAARTTQANSQLLGLNRLGAWGLGLGLRWSAGDKGGGPLGLRVSQLVVVVFLGFR